MSTLRVLVVDDTITYRRIVTQALQQIQGVEVIGSANCGSVALKKIAALHPDLVTLDLEMPDMDGIEVLKALREKKLSCQCVMVSSFTQRGGELTVKALQAGAFDFVTKSGSGTPAQQLEELSSRLKPIAVTIARRRGINLDSSPVTLPGIQTKSQPTPPPPNKPIQIGKIRAVMIGVSTGGPNALAKVIPALPRDLGVPVLIVQHMPPLFTGYLAESLQKNCPNPVFEGKHDDLLPRNCVVIAPGGKHMKIQRSPEGIRTLLNEDPPENNCRPAVDTLFRSGSLQMPGEICAVILTGMGADGTRGLRLLKRHGCPAIGQDEATSTVYGMPKEAFDAGLIDFQLPIERVAPAIASIVQGRNPC